MYKQSNLKVKVLSALETTWSYPGSATAICKFNTHFIIIYFDSKLYIIQKELGSLILGTHFIAPKGKSEHTMKL